MNTLKTILEFMKNNKNELHIIKLMVVIIVNTWLLIIFFKILLIENENIIGNNVALTKMQTLTQPLLQILGLDMLSPSTIKMLMVTCIVLGVNITILHFNTVVLMVLPLGITRYGYKMYTNYLINSKNRSLNVKNRGNITKSKNIGTSTYSNKYKYMSEYSNKLVTMRNNNSSSGSINSLKS